MPKQKTSRATRKRFKLTGRGKLLRRHAMASHLLRKKSAKRKRSFRKPKSVVGADVREVRRLLGKR